MLCKTLLGTTLALAAATAINAAPQNNKRQAVGGNFGLTVNDTADFLSENIFQFQVFFANNSAYFGQINYELYSEPLIVNGGLVGGDTSGGLSFLSIHQSPTGYQYGYIEPGKTTPLGFSVPHTGGVVPSGAVTTGFSFNAGGALVWDGKNKFYACQTAALAALEAFQVVWNGAGQLPSDATCKGPIKIIESSPCNRVG
jgi:hypothetical protein